MSSEIEEVYANLEVVILGAYEEEDLPRIEWEEGVPGILELYIRVDSEKKIGLIIDRSFLNELNESMDICEKTYKAESQAHK